MSVEDGDTREEQAVVGRPRLLIGLLAGSLTLNLVFVLRLATGGMDSAPNPVAAADPQDAPPVASQGVPTPAPAVVQAPAPAPVQAPMPVAAPAAAADGWQVARAEVTHSVARAFHEAVGDEDGPALAAEYTRLFVWDLDMLRDLQKGDEVAAVWRKKGDDFEIAAATLRSQKLGTTLRAYRYTRPGDDWPSYWRADGVEVPARLKGGPLDAYEQVTSLLKDRPHHRGMDFKCPVGTPVNTPRAGVVDRTDWNWRHNGNSVAIRWDDGHLVKFLHLSDTKVKAGERVTAGTVIGLSGNTGRSTAPHLHYQIEAGKKAIDPLDYHGTYKRTLPDAARAEFARAVERLDGRLAGEAL